MNLCACAAWVGLVALATTLPVAAADASADRALRVAVSQTNASPFVLYTADGRFDGGLARDIIDELARTLHLQPAYLNTPRGRIEPGLRSGELDAACFLAPDWVNAPDSMHWSPVLLQIQQVVVTRADAPPVRSADDLHGMRIGTQLNFRYPELEPLFAAGHSTRVDALSADANLVKLRSGRVEAMIDVDLSVLYAINRAGWFNEMQVDPLWIDSNPVHCAFSGNFVQRHPGWHRALKAMVDSGQVERWIERYVARRDLLQRGL